MKFTKEELDEIKDAIENSLKYYQDLLDDALSNPETKKNDLEYARARIKIIESIKQKLKLTGQKDKRRREFLGVALDCFKEFKFRKDKHRMEEASRFIQSRKTGSLSFFYYILLGGLAGGSSIIRLMFSPDDGERGVVFCLFIALYRTKNR